MHKQASTTMRDQTALQVMLHIREPAPPPSAIAQHKSESTFAPAQYDSGNTCIAGMSSQPLNVFSHGEGSAGVGAGRKRGRENASGPAIEEGDLEQE